MNAVTPEALRLDSARRAAERIILEAQKCATAAGLLLRNDGEPPESPAMMKLRVLVRAGAEVLAELEAR